MNDYRNKPNLIFCGDDRFPFQICQKIAIDYSKEIIRVSLRLHDHLVAKKKTTKGEKSTLTKPKQEWAVVYYSLHTHLIREMDSNDAQQ